MIEKKPKRNIQPIRCKYDTASVIGHARVRGVGLVPPNPIKRRYDYLPLQKLRRGESLFINKAEVSHADLINATNVVWRANRQYGDFLLIIKHPEHKHDYDVMEIVRIK